MVPAPPLLELRNVTLWAHGRLLFPDTSWKIHPGEHWAIVGPNASGKSTLARALCGEVSAIRGELRRPAEGVCRVSFEDQAALVLRYSRYLQGRYESIEEDDAPTAADLLGPAADPPSVTEELLERLGLRELLGRRVIHLSNGEARKLLVARALARRPRLLVLEEPLQGLDQSSRREITELLLEVARGGVGIVMVTAVPGDVMPPVDNVLYVREGAVVALGRRANLAPGGRLARAASPPLAPGSEASLPVPPAGAAQSEPLVELRNVTVSYDGFRLLEHVSWTVREGESWALVGPNGSGKTTLLSLILADNPQAYANDVHLFGHRRGDGVSIWDIRRSLGHVSPEAQIHLDLSATVLEAVSAGFADGSRLRHTATADELRAATAWARELDLGALLDTPCRALSYGAARLVLLARALAKGPRLLVLDEPCQGLDEAHRETVLRAVDGLCRRRATTVIFVTHDPLEIPSSIGFLLGLEGGRAVATGERWLEGAPA